MTVMVFRAPLFEDPDECERIVGHQVEIRIGAFELDVDSFGGFLFWLRLTHGAVLTWESGRWPELHRWPKLRRYDGAPHQAPAEPDAGRTGGMR